MSEPVSQSAISHISQPTATSAASAAAQYPVVRIHLRLGYLHAPACEDACTASESPQILHSHCRHTPRPHHCTPSHTAHSHHCTPSHTTHSHTAHPHILHTHTLHRLPTHSRSTLASTPYCISDWMCTRTSYCEHSLYCINLHTSHPECICTVRRSLARR